MWCVIDNAHVLWGVMQQRVCVTETRRRGKMPLLLLLLWVAAAYRVLTLHAVSKVTARVIQCTYIGQAYSLTSYVYYKFIVVALPKIFN